ncbi:MAG: carbohydrate binding family 9 domain-containing protein [Acidobacteria bacterium]|nr:carbohydrate binding family 9 domain-containing protein [Acidobacteriota bacterium]
MQSSFRFFDRRNLSRAASLLAIAVTSLALEAEAQQRRSRDPNTPTVTAVRAQEPIVLDGLLTEEAWKLAEPASAFLQRDPRQGEPASERTEVRILFDTRHLYLGIVCYDSTPSALRATELRRDNSLNNDDLFEVIFDTLHDHRNGYLFRINPLGTQYDSTITNEGQTVNANWDEKWEVKSRITEEGWMAEIVIPFKSVRFATGDDLVWGVNFRRIIRRKNEDVYWTAHNRNYRFEEVSRAGHLVGLSEIVGFTARVKPFFTTGVSQALVRGQQETKHLTDIGIEDLKYLITPKLALDLTVNPDFAQADVDEAQINLSRFNLFFPEKREFFQEGSGIFQFGTGEPFGRPQVLLFHSRRIGLSENREEIPILGGLKLTGKQGPLDIGLLNMQTRRFSSTPGQNFTVARVKANLLSRSYVGAMFVRNTAGLNGQSSWTGGLDASFTFFQNLSLRGFLARNDAPQTSEREWAGQGKIEWNSDRFEFVAERIHIQENFQPQTGFVARAEPDWKGIKRSFAEAAYKPRPQIRFIRQFELLTSLEYITNQEGDLDTRTAEIGWTTDFESGDAVEVSYQRTFERLVRPLRIRGGGTVPRGDYSFDQLQFMYRAFRGRKLSGNVRIEVGEFYNGRITTLDLSPQFKPTPNLSIDPGYQWTRITLPGLEPFTTHQLNTSLNYSFTQKWLTRTTFLVNSQDQQYGINFRLNYIFRPGDDLFFVYNETRTYGSQSQLQNRALIVKTTFSFDF